MSPTKAKILTAGSLFALMISFQNCAQRGFQAEGFDPDQKVESDGSLAESEVEIKSEADLACGDVGRHIDWILTDALVDGQVVDVPSDYKFVFKIHKNELPKTKVCKGDCGRAYKLNLHSFSGPIDKEYTCRWDEQRGQFISKIYSTYDAIEAAQHGGDDLHHELDRLFAGKLLGEFKTSVSADRQEMELDFGSGNVLVFQVR